MQMFAWAQCLHAVKYSQVSFNFKQLEKMFLYKAVVTIKQLLGVCNFTQGRDFDYFLLFDFD